MENYPYTSIKCSKFRIALILNNSKQNYYKLREKNILSYPKLKEQYGNVELDQMLFDLGIKTSWSLTALEDLLTANKKLQLDLKNELSAKSSSSE